MPGKAKWKWLLHHTPHTLTTPLLAPASITTDVATMTPSNWALCIIFAAFSGRCLPGFLIIAHVLHDWATLWPTTYRPAPCHPSSLPSATYHSLLTQPLCLPPTRLSTGWWFIWLRRLLLATWWVDASETNSPYPSPPFVALPSSLLSHSYCQRIYFNTNFCYHFCFYCKHFFAILFWFMWRLRCSIVASTAAAVTLADTHSV